MCSPTSSSTTQKWRVNIPALTMMTICCCCWGSV
jgi:hypothetical protein